MAVKIKAVARGKPGVPGGGDKRFYASPVMEGEVNLDDLTRAIERVSTVSGADIRAALYALVDVSLDSLGRGAIVRMGDLGSLRITLSAEGMATPEEVSAATVRRAGMIFTPGARLKAMLAALKYVKA
jgi:predicted histone-like DNA-binding protein